MKMIQVVHFASTHFMPLVSSMPTEGLWFAQVLKGIEGDQWHEMDHQSLVNLQKSNSFAPKKTPLAQKMKFSFKDFHGFLRVCSHLLKKPSQRKKCPCSELFWSAFSRIRTEYGEIRRISPYSVQMRKNEDQNNSECGHFLRSALKENYIFFAINFGKRAKITKRIVDFLLCHQ